MNIAGAILSGGQNKRMGGKNKAFIEINGIPLIQRALEAFKEIFDEVILVTNSPADYVSYSKDCHIVLDIIKNIGPLGGIHSALSYTSKRSVFFIACDMPFLHNGMIQRQIRLFNKLSCEALVPQIGKYIEPLHAIYAKALVEKIHYYVDKDSLYSIRGFLKSINSSYFKLKDDPFYRRIFKNVNTPEDLEEARNYESKIKSMA